MIATAARLPGIAAVVAQCPFTDSIASLGAMNPLVSARVTALAMRDLIGARLGASPVMVPTAGNPGEVALMTAPDAYPGFLKLVPDGAELRNEVAARIGVTDPALPSGPARGESPLPDPVLRVRDRLGRTVGTDPSLRRDGAAR